MIYWFYPIETKEVLAFFYNEEDWLLLVKLKPLLLGFDADLVVIIVLYVEKRSITYKNFIKKMNKIRLFIKSIIFIALVKF
jgi:hypothetical protein